MFSSHLLVSLQQPISGTFYISNYEKHAPRVSQVIAAVAKVSCKHGLWLVARVNRKKPFRFSTRGFQYFHHKENHLTRCGANVRFPVPRGTNVTFLYCERQVSRLIASGFDSSASVSFPVSQWIIPLLAKYGDEFVQDSHLLPFSPDTHVRHLTHRYLIVFSLTTVSVAHRLFSVKCCKIRKSGHFPFHIPHPRRSSWTLCAIRAQWFSLLPILSGISE